MSYIKIIIISGTKIIKNIKIDKFDVHCCGALNECREAVGAMKWSENNLLNRPLSRDGFRRGELALLRPSFPSGGMAASASHNNFRG